MRRLRFMLCLIFNFFVHVAAITCSSVGVDLHQVAAMSNCFFFFNTLPFVFVKGAGTNEGCLVEIMCSRTNKEIADIKAAYKLSKLVMLSCCVVTLTAFFKC